MRGPTDDTAARLALTYQAADLRVDVGTARVSRGGIDIPLPRLSFDLLRVLLESAPRIVSIDGLMAQVWPGLVVSPETVSQRVKLLRDALGDDSREPRYIAVVRGRGYRWVSEVTLVTPAGPPAQAGAAPEPADPPQAPVVAPLAPARRTAGRKWLAVLALALLAVVLVGQWATRQGKPARTPVATARTAVNEAATAGRSVAVLPFDNLSDDAKDDALAFGLAESLLHQLAGLRELEVIARTSSFAFKGKSVDAREIGRELNVRYLVEGSLQSDGPRLRVTAQLVDASTGAHVWSLRFDRTRQDIFAVQDEIALQVARALQLSLEMPAADRLVGRGTQNFDAYLAFLQGRSLLATGRVADAEAAASHFLAATQLDPKFAAAYVSRAQAVLFAAEFAPPEDRARRFDAARRDATGYVERALQIDPQDGAAYLQRGYLEAFTDLAAAEASYRKGLALQPSDASGYAGLATVLYENPARRGEALAALDQARRLDPLEPAYDVTKSVYLLYDLGDVRAAESLLRQVLQRQPLYLPALSRFGELLWCCVGRSSEAVRYLEQALALEPRSEWTRRSLIAAYLAAGDPESAQQVIDAAAPRSTVLQLQLLNYKLDWRRAGEAAFAAIDDQTYLPIDEPHLSMAIRHYARLTGERARAIAALQELSGAEWDEQGRPSLPARPGLRSAAVGLADLLQLDGDVERSRRLLSVLRQRIDTELRQSGRSRLWYAQDYPVIAMMSGERGLALDWLRRAVDANMLMVRPTQPFEEEPLFEPLHDDATFLTLQKRVMDRVAVEHRRLEQLRAEGLIPRRS